MVYCAFVLPNTIDCLVQFRPSRKSSIKYIAICFINGQGDCHSTIISLFSRIWRFTLEVFFQFQNIRRKNIQASEYNKILPRIMIFIQRTYSFLTAIIDIPSFSWLDDSRSPSIVVFWKNDRLLYPPAPRRYIRFEILSSMNLKQRSHQSLMSHFPA